MRKITQKAWVLSGRVLRAGDCGIVRLPGYPVVAGKTAGMPTEVHAECKGERTITERVETLRAE